MKCPLKRTSHHHGDLKAELISATRALVEEHGADAVSINQAARQAGVSTAAPYKHFKDRDALLTAVAFDAMITMHTETGEILDQHPKGSLEGIVAISRHYISFATEHANIFKLMFSSTRAHAEDPEMMARAPEGFGLVREAVGEYLGCTADDPLTIERSFTLWSFVHGLSFIIIDDKTDKVGVTMDPTLLIPKAVETILKT